MELNNGFGLPSSTTAPPSTSTHASPNDSDPTPSSVSTDALKNNSAAGASTAAPADPQANLRSCVTCRRRKIRCNKVHPCSHCVKAKTECIFPKPGRAPRKSKKATEVELLARLKTLEGIVQNIGQSSAEEKTSPEVKNETKPTREWSMDGCAGRIPVKPDIESVEQEMGRLVISDDKSRYVSHRFWTRFGDEIEELKNMIDCPTSDEDDYPSPGDSKCGSSPWSNGSGDGFLFGYWSLAHSLREFHPPPERFGVIWQNYLENVAPVVPIFHRPSLKALLWNAVANLDMVNRNTEALLFAVYHTTVTSMTPEQCRSQLGEDRDAALARYRFAVEQAFARANLLNTHSLVLLQSLVLHLVCMRQKDDTRHVLSMTALAIQIGRGIGIHRDGTAFGLSPFKMEMRRRLWMQIAILDFYSAEDHGCDPVLNEASYDTLPPLNINDEDITPDATEPPKERVGCTDMTFLLFRGDMVVVARRLSHIPPGVSCKRYIASFSQKEREEMVENLGKKLESKYVQHCHMEIPIQWVCGALSRLIVARLLLMIHHPMTLDNTERSVPAEETENRLFLSAIEIIEFSLLLETNSNTAKWSWFFRTYMQWHALAYVLTHLCVRQMCPVVDRAWRAVNTAYKVWELKGPQKKGMLWPGIRKLMERALQFREIQLQQLTAQYATGESYSANMQPANDFVMAQGSSLSTYLSQPQQESTLTGTLPMDPTVGFTPDPNNYNICPADSSSLTWPSLPQDCLYPTDISCIPPSWDEWNQVVREFQIENDNMASSNQIPIWLEGGM